MGRKFGAVFLSGSAAFVAHAACAASFSFSGVVTALNDGAGAAVPNIGSLEAGDPVAGSITYDPTLIDGAGIPLTCAGPSPCTRYEDVISAFSMSIDGLTWTMDGTGRVTIDDEESSSYPQDEVVAFNSGIGISGPAVEGLTGRWMQFALGGNDDILTGEDSLSLADVLGLATNNTVGGLLNLLSLSDGSDVRYEIDSVSAAPPVPLPAALPLFVAGLMGFGLLGRVGKA